MCPMLDTFDHHQSKIWPQRWYLLIRLGPGSRLSQLLLFRSGEGSDQYSSVWCQYQSQVPQFKTRRGVGKSAIVFVSGRGCGFMILLVFAVKNVLWDELFCAISPKKTNYHLVMTNSLPWKDPPFLIGKPSINGPFSMAMLNNQRVSLYTSVYVDSMNVLFQSPFLRIQSPFSVVQRSFFCSTTSFPFTPMDSPIFPQNFPNISRFVSLSSIFLQVISPMDSPRFGWWNIPQVLVIYIPMDLIPKHLVDNPTFQKVMSLLKWGTCEIYKLYDSYM